MNKIEVNPRLFITCRLCLEDLGVYQIVPDVKEQILYCFEINVEPFDGLPQLICKKCEVILTKFAETKKKFIEKQSELKNKLEQESHNVTGQLSQAGPEKIDNLENFHFESQNPSLNVTRKRKPCISSSSKDFELDTIGKENKDDTDSEIREKIPSSWTSSYTKKYVCRFCNGKFVSTKKIKSHIFSKHSALNKQFRNIFKRQCEVPLPKIDSELNLTGSRNKVMYTREKIIENVNPKYYVIYTIKEKDDERYDSLQEDTWSLNTRKAILQGNERSDSSEDEIFVTRKKKRTRRLYSRSSNETVVLDTDNKTNISDNYKQSPNSEKAPPVELGECINIDDSTDTDSENIKDVSKTKSKNKYIVATKTKDFETDAATINNIITTCQKKYIKKHYDDNFVIKSNKTATEISTQLKRKILSIGRKLISRKKGVNCTPLVRFMEHKNLDIVWLSRPITYVNQESNYIRIMARMKNIGENVDYETGWADYVPSPTYGQFIGVASHTNKGDNMATISPRVPDKVANGIDSSEVPCATTSEIAMPSSVVFTADANLNGTDTKKLLNANPVANPKQLPKKSLVNEVKTVKNITTNQIAQNIEIPSLDSNDADSEFCMPIITSTTSLAVPFSIPENTSSHQVEDSTNSKNYEQRTEAPRIKVKPPSELMSAETLNRMNGPSQMQCIVTTTPLPVQNENNFIDIYVPPISTLSQFQNNLPNTNFTMSFAPEPSWKNDYMILDTTELPNTTTKSPFQYFRRLLQLHNITLLDTDVELSNDFHCLIKFKVLYKQETNNQPVILCLALFCSKNVFCLKIKDRNQENINISRISPNWQWEVLKIYKGEVVNKLLTNAQKLGQDVYEFTNSFLCILKSINLIKS